MQPGMMGGKDKMKPTVLDEIAIPARPARSTSWERWR
jgi:hypothetical protein